MQQNLEFKGQDKQTKCQGHQTHLGPLKPLYLKQGHRYNPMRMHEFKVKIKKSKTILEKKQSPRSGLQKQRVYSIMAKKCEEQLSKYNITSVLHQIHKQRDQSDSQQRLNLVIDSNILSIEGLVLNKRQVLFSPKAPVTVNTPQPAFKLSSLHRTQKFSYTATSKPKKIFSFTDPKELAFLTYLSTYRNMLWKINYSNQLIVTPPEQHPKAFRVYVGRGNNSNLIKAVLRRRWWWNIVQSYDREVNFVWTQIKIQDYFKNQKTAVWKSIWQGELKGQNINSPLLNFQEAAKLAPLQKRRSNVDQFFAQRELIAKNCNHVKLQAFQQLRVQNHLQCNYVIGNKKALFFTLNSYFQSKQQQCDFIPLTFHIRQGTEDASYGKFIQSFKREDRKKRETGVGSNLWIVKPGQSTNRGTGITVHFRPETIKRTVQSKQKHSDGIVKTYIIQKYIQRPMLYNRRKFDLRHYMLLTSVQGILKGYWYQEGYVRTSSLQFTTRNQDPFVHLTNDAVQKYSQDYGKYERANKLSYAELDKYIQKQYKCKSKLFKEILPRMKEIAAETIRACHSTIDPKRLQNNFQLFGLDFMIDQEFKVYLIQCNSNPCLQLCCPILAKLIPDMLHNLLKITLDTQFPPPINWPDHRKTNLKGIADQNRFFLIFDSRGEEQTGVSSVLQGQFSQQQQFEDDGGVLDF